MKRFKIRLSIGTVSFIHATHYEAEDTRICFYRNESLIAEFAMPSVIRIDEVRRLDEPPSTTGGRRRFSGL